jgi:hypothetical protein
MKLYTEADIGERLFFKDSLNMGNTWVAEAKISYHATSENKYNHGPSNIITHKYLELSHYLKNSMH